MAEYKDWNKAIFNYFFGNMSYAGLSLFNVRDDIIRQIGEEEFNMERDKAETDYVEKTLHELLRYNGYDWTIKHDGRAATEAGIPWQIGLLAFFIYVGSKLGDQSSNLREDAYWKKFEEIAEAHAFKPFIFRSTDKQRDYMHDEIIGGVEGFISKSSGYEFKFPTLFGRGRDFVGRYLFQAMITKKDIYFLKKKFDKYSSYDNLNMEGVIGRVIQGNEFSKAFRKIRDTHYSKLKEEVTKIAEYLDDYECIDELGEVRRCVPRYFYEYIGSEDEFYFSRETKNQPEDILEDLKRDTKDFKFFVRDNLNKFFEIKKNAKIKVGDTFSILGTVEYFENLRNNEDALYRLDKVSGGNIPEPEEIADDLYLMHGIEAVDYDGIFVHFDTKENITFEMGLKVGSGQNCYVENAGPYAKLNDSKIFSVTNEKNKNQSPINGYVRVNWDIGTKHYLMPKGNPHDAKYYEIKPISEVNASIENREIYNVINDSSIQKVFDYEEGTQVAFGAYLKNIDDFDNFNSVPIQTNSFLLYVLEILKMHENREDFPMPLKLKQELLARYGNTTEFAAYINDNKYTDNYICKYLNYLRKH